VVSRSRKSLDGIVGERRREPERGGMPDAIVRRIPSKSTFEAHSRPRPSDTVVAAAMTAAK
jgi:hypothetical protein